MRRKKLLLINPGNPWFFYFTLPLALGYVAAVTPDNWDIEVVDEKIRRFNYATAEADLVGITVMTPQARRAYEIADQFTRRNIPVVLGGIHVSMLPHEASRYATSVVVGEAENIWPRILRITLQGALHSRDPLMAFLLLVSHYNQRKFFHKELRRNLAELKTVTQPTAFDSISMY